MSIVARMWRWLRDQPHRRPFTSVLIVIGLVVSPGYYINAHDARVQDQKRCESGNEFRAANQLALHKVDEYINALLAGFGATTPVDPSKLTKEQREQYQIIATAIANARKAFLESIEDPAFAQRDCSLAALTPAALATPPGR